MSSHILHVESSQHVYPIIIEAGCRKGTFQLIEKYIAKKPSKFFIITDENVASLYLQEVVASFPKEEQIVAYVIPSGEKSKSFKQYDMVLTAALEAKLDRKSLIIALGGGVVGDLAGFVAATYMRGIPYVQIPTTLLAHDSSVGGKVGINHPLGKNMIGAFHQPSLVIYDPETLLSLPEEEWRSGFAEVIKHGFIADIDFLTWIRENVTSFQHWDVESLSKMLYRSIQVKAKIVQQDEKEADIRAYLNLGHTLGHAIEAELGYGSITHGEAVAIGILFALRLSERKYDIDLQVNVYEELLTRLGYEVHVPYGLEMSRLVERMKMDKKSQDGIIHFVLLKGIGVPTIQEMAESVIIQQLGER